MTFAETIVLNRAQDPSHTLTLRNAFANAMKARFTSFRKLVAEVIIDDNVFGVVVNRKPGTGAFSFPLAADKISAFKKWMEEQIKDDILQVSQMQNVSFDVDNAWTNKYIEEAYKKGIMRARTQLRFDREISSEIAVNRRRRKLKRPPSIADTGGISASLTSLAHMERLRILYSRTFSELKGVTDSMSQLITRVLSESIVNGASTYEMVASLNKVISGIGKDLSVVDSLGRFIPSQLRAEMIARTEIIRAHAEAQLTEFKEWGIHGVSAKAEFITAGDARVCERCASLERKVITIDQARGMIPVHPRCRCVWIPHIVN